MIDQMFIWMNHRMCGMNLLERMGQYLVWADKTVWEMVQGLTEEEFDRPLGEGGGSIRKRYIHLAQDTWEWYYDWIDKDPDDEPNFEGMERGTLFGFLTDYVHKFINMIENRLVNEITFDSKGKDITIVFEEILFHLVNHAAYHRGQIAMGLRLLGKEVQMTDYVPHRIAIA
ncbi:MAG: DinB family protein [Candidatus Thorarchaeota archaeon]